MWDSVLVQFGLLGGLKTLIRSWKIHLVFVRLFLLHNWMFDYLPQRNHRVHFCQAQAVLNICAHHGLGPFYKLAKWCFHCTSGFGFVIQDITPFSKGDSWIGSFNKARGGSALSPCFLCILKLVKSLTVCTKVVRESRSKLTRADNLKPRGRWECEQNCAWADMQSIC